MPWKKTNVNHPIRPGKPVAGEIEILGMEISMVQTDWFFFFDVSILFDRNSLNCRKENTQLLSQSSYQIKIDKANARSKIVLIAFLCNKIP